MNHNLIVFVFVCAVLPSACGGHFDNELSTAAERWASLEASIEAREDTDAALLWMMREEPEEDSRVKAVELLATVPTRLDRQEVLESVFRYELESSVLGAARGVFERAWPRDEMVARYYGLLMRCASGLRDERWTSCHSLTMHLRYPRDIVEHILAEPEPIGDLRTLFLIHLIDQAVGADRSLADDMRVNAWLDQREPLRDPACDGRPLGSIRDYWKARATAPQAGHR